MQTQPQAQATPPQREHAGGVIGVGVGLFAILALVLMIFQQRGEQIDARVIFEQVFACGEPPLGFELTEGVLLPGGDRVARLDLVRLEEWEAGIAEAGQGAPRSLYLALHKRPKAVTRQFASLGRGEPEKVGLWFESRDFALDMVLDRDELEWSNWKATYVHEREYRADGGWSDGVRVNLARGESYAVLHARWSDEVEADPQALVPLLIALELRE